MGRCNNARTRAAAESLRNTPARARFSKPPATSSSTNPSNRGGRGRGRGQSNSVSVTGSNAANPQPNTSESGRNNTTANINAGGTNRNRGSKMIPAHLVVAAKQKLISKQESGGQQHQSTTTTSTGILKEITIESSEQPQHHGIKNVKDLDEITLSNSSIEMIFQLLRDLNVVADPMNDNDNLRKYEQNSDVNHEDADEVHVSDIDDGCYNHSVDTVNHEYCPQKKQLRNSINHSNVVYGSGYVEQDDDYDETFPGRWQPCSDVEFDDDTMPIIEEVSTMKRLSGEANQDNVSRIPKDDDECRKDNPIYQHLTNHLSFSSNVAVRACKEASASDIRWSTVTLSNQLSKVMDWLCLHLSENELENGFRKRPKCDATTNAQCSYSVRSTSTITKYKAIPHPSISIITPNYDVSAKRSGEHAAWQRQAALEDRAVQFLKFGFEHAEIVKALQQQQQNIFVNDDFPDDPIDDTVTLCILLKSIEEKIVPIKAKENTTMTSIALDTEEIEQECEVLLAIYEDHCTIESIVTTTMAIKRCKISIGSNYENQDTDMGELLVFIGPGYPTLCAPMFLFYNSNLPWPFLRRINEELIRRSADEVGRPIIYEMVLQLVESYPGLWNEYQKEKLAKEFEVNQHHYRRNGLVGAVENECNDDEIRIEELTSTEIKSLSRRQKSKLIQAQKSYDAKEKDSKQEEQRRLKQEQLQERIKHENQYLRQTLADRAVLQREKDRLNDGLRRVTRLALSRSLNDGKSVDDARIAAVLVELEYRKEHGMDMPVENAAATIEKKGNEIEQSQPEQSNTVPIPQATPTTRAFMDRLRQLYSDAAVHGKASISGLADPTVHGSDQQMDKAIAKLPCPIAVSVGDVGTILQEHVLCMQEEQPWLVSGEARAPLAAATTTSEKNERPPNLTQNLSKRQNDVSDRLKKAHEKSQNYPSKSVQNIRQQTRALPAYQMRDEIVSAVKQNQVTLISASTGAGKTTVVPSLLLNDMIENGVGCYANIWVTQPRRISAIAVAERIASERGEKVGETCGYSIKLERKCSSRTRITLCTTGILLRRLQCDPDLANMSHLIIDEVHERDINSDFALIILKELLKRRKNLKLILMSATFEKSIFASYFNGCAIVEIPGRAHPVREFRLEDVIEMTGYEVQEGSDYALNERSESSIPRWSKTALKKLYHPKFSNNTIQSLSIVDESKINYEVVAALVEHLNLHCDDGAILIFMPGMAEITNTIDELRKKEIFQSDKVIIYPLHSSLSSSEQSQVFQVPPKGIRKIVVATNIAETSITVSDVVYVVDSGRVKENRRDEIKEAPALVDCWVSKASAQQRRGRAGRVRPGVAYHLFSSHTYDNVLQPYQICEMSRVGIEDLVLQVLILDLGDPCSVLARAITPPSAVAMKNSLKLLEELGAIECQWQSHFDESSTCESLVDTKTELTPLGFHLATLPVDPRIGKVIIYGALFSCIDPALTIAAAMSSKSPFISSFDNREAADRARQTLSVDGSDHLTILNAFDTWKSTRLTRGERAASKFVRDNHLSWHVLNQLEEIRNQLFDLLCDIGFLPSTNRITGDKSSRNISDDAINVNARNLDLVKAVLCAGMYPNIILAPRTLVGRKGYSSKQVAGETAFQSHNKGEVYLHPSVLSYSSKALPYRYCCYHEIIQTRKLYVRDITIVSPFALLLFGGALQVYHIDGIITIDKWLKFRISRVAATLIKYLRSEMEKMLLRKIVSPGQDLAEIPHTKAITDAICALFLEK